MTRTAELIVYACPTGALAAQVDRFYAASRERFGPNSAHAYPPHITLTGFFHDAATAIPAYTAALDGALAAARARGFTHEVRIMELATTAEFHALLIESPSLEALTADFAARAASPTRRTPLRLKTNLHLSLAYGFHPADGPGLGHLACALVDPAAPTAWDLRLYERIEGGGWYLHASWPL